MDAYTHRMMLMASRPEDMKHGKAAGAALCSPMVECSVSPQTPLVRHTNKVSESQGCVSLAVVYVSSESEAICPHERLTKLLIDDSLTCTLMVHI